MIFVGVDPGKTGYVTICDDEDGCITFHPIPITNDRLNSNELYASLDWIEYTGSGHKIYVENIHSLFGMSAKSNFSFGGIFYSILAVLDMIGDVTLVQPKEWQKEMHKGIENNKDKKVMSLQAAQKLFPDMDFKRTERCKTSDHNLIDSLLICEYGKRKYYENKS